MKRTLLSVALLSTLALGCAKESTTGKGGMVQLAKRLRGSEAAPAVVVVDDAKMPILSAPGDFVVLRFSGSFRKAPVTLTQRVLSRDGTVAMMEMTLTENKKSQTIRARIDRPALGPEQVLDVVRVENGKEKAATIGVYDAFMQKTMPDVDMNEETLGTETATMSMGGKEMSGKVTRYKVKMGGKDATMSIFHADGFAWGDVAGEIQSADGKMIYKAEVTELGNANTASASASR
jgi:hypothetical protein